VLFMALVIFLILIPIIFKKPTCTDGKQNGTEAGVDCGGSCSRMCEAEVADPVILWSRAFPVTGSIYNLVAYIENRNKNSAVFTAPYEFRIYDTDNKLLGRREGKTFIPPNQQFVILESRFDAGQSQIKSVSFEFKTPLGWVKKEPTLQTIPIRVSNIILDNNQNTPTLTAIINNDSIYNLPEFDVFAVIYDSDQNAINASKTHKEQLLRGKSLPVVFTWPEALTAFPATKDVMVLINPFSVSF